MFENWIIKDSWLAGLDFVSAYTVVIVVYFSVSSILVATKLLNPRLMWLAKFASFLIVATFAGAWYVATVSSGLTNPVTRLVDRIPFMWEAAEKRRMAYDALMAHGELAAFKQAAGYYDYSNLSGKDRAWKSVYCSFSGKILSPFVFRRNSPMPRPAETFLVKSWKEAYYLPSNEANCFVLPSELEPSNLSPSGRVEFDRVAGREMLLVGDKALMEAGLRKAKAYGDRLLPFPKETRMEVAYKLVQRDLAYDPDAKRLVDNGGDPFSISDALKSGINASRTGNAVCGGYASYLTLILAYAGVDAKYVTGTVELPTASFGHAWVESGGTHYDPTFDDGEATPWFARFGKPLSEMPEKHTVDSAVEWFGLEKKKGAGDWK